MRSALLLITTNATAALLPAALMANSFDLGGFEGLLGEPVTTSVTGMPMRSSDVPINMSIVTAEQIERSGAQTVPEILQNLVGIDVVQWTSNHYDVAIRGFNQAYNPRLLVMINGRQIYLDHYGLTAWSALPIQLGEIRQIEVVRGPNSALFGFNAVSGVINIVTYNPIYDQRSEISTSVDSDGGVQASGFATVGETGRYGIRLSAGRSDLAQNGSRPEPLNRIFEQDAIRHNIALDSSVALGDRTQLAFDFSTVKADHNELEGGYNFAQANYHIYAMRTRLFHDSDFGLWTFGAYQNSFDETINSAGITRVGGARLVGRNQITVANIENQFVPAAGHNLRLLAEYRDNTIETGFGGGTDIAYNVLSASGAWTWQVTDALSTTASVRYDWLELDADGDPFFPYSAEAYDQDYKEFSYNLAAAYHVTDLDKIRLTTARGIQTPSLLELGLAFPPQPSLGGIFVLGNPQIEPTTLDTFELAYERAIPAIQGQFGAAVFYQRFDELKSLPPTGVGGVTLVNGVPVLTSNNVGRSEAIGAEFTIDGRLGEAWRYGLSYSLIDIEDDISVNQNALDYSVLFEDGTPTHAIKGQLGFDHGSWRSDMFARWQSDRDMIDNPTTASFVRANVDGFVNLDARIGYQMSDQLEISLTGQNLLGDVEPSARFELDRRFILRARLRLN